MLGILGVGAMVLMEIEQVKCDKPRRLAAGRDATAPMNSPARLVSYCFSRAETRGVAVQLALNQR